MIAIALSNGSLLKLIPDSVSEVYGFHSTFGFISERAAKERLQSRIVRKLEIGRDREAKAHFAQPDKWLFKVSIAPGMKLSAVENCEVKARDGGYEISTPGHGSFLVSKTAALDPNRLGEVIFPDDEKEAKKVQRALLIGAAFFLLFLALPKDHVEQIEPQIIQQVVVNVKPKIQKQVVVPQMTHGLPQDPNKKLVVQRDQQVKRAVQQDLGFLGLLGRKDLNKALGGAPTKLTNASPGAGAGGSEGSGGEVLVGIGAGLKRVTVGNTGTAGLGGIGTKGRGGGQGGYGNASVGSGEGKALSSIPISQDMVLEGGLSKAAIQATIAKYLSQVRACYEQGLLKNPGLG